MRSFKKLVAGLSSLVMCLSLVPVGASADTSYLKGDVNGDGVVNGLDTLALSNFLNGKKAAANGATADRLDVDRNGVIDENDLEFLKGIILGVNNSSSVNYDSNITALPQQEARTYYVFDASSRQMTDYYTLSPVANISSTSTRSIIGDTDDRVPENNLNGVVKIIYGYDSNNNPTSWGTGFVIGKHTILTAAHCVCDRSNKKGIRIQDIAFYSDYNTINGSMDITPLEYHVPLNYVETTSYGEYDYALITVEDDLSNYICFSLGVANQNITSINPDIYITGFGGSGNTENGESNKVNPDLIGNMSTGTGKIKDVTNYYIGNYVDTVAGSSGGPLYIINNDNDNNILRTVIAINNSSGGTSNSSIRITTDILHFVYNNSNL